jgi:hypothetical protein
MPSCLERIHIVSHFLAVRNSRPSAHQKNGPEKARGKNGKGLDPGYQFKSLRAWSGLN